MHTSRRLPAEWEPCQAVLMAWPHADTDWSPILSQAEDCFAAMVAAITPFAPVVMLTPDEERTRSRLAHVDPRRIIILPAETNDTWTRDYGPVTVCENGHALPLDFKFNGWGLKFAANLDNMVNTKLTRSGFFRAKPEEHLGFVLEGGSIESDGCGTVLTTDSCLLNPNRNGGMTCSQILQYIKETTGADRVISLKSGELIGDDTDGHIDTLARFAPPGDVIFYTGCCDCEDPHFQPLARMAEELCALRTPGGQPYHLVELPLPDPIFDEEGQRLPATYANFLIVNGAVILPVYGQPMKDRMAADLISTAMPDYKVVTVDCRTLVLQHGSLHCSTMQLPLETLSFC